MATGRNLENGKSQYFCNCLTDFDEIWHNGTSGTLATDQSLKLMELESPICRPVPSWKMWKSWYLCNRFTDFDEIWHGDVKFQLPGWWWVYEKYAKI